MMDVLMIAHFTQIPGEMGNGRFHYLAEGISKDNIEVEEITSSFSHIEKKQRENTSLQDGKVNYKITLLPEPGYSKNISVSRLVSHFIFARNLNRYLKKRKKPDVVYCSVPSLSAASIAAKYAKRNNIRFIIDVQDIWPEAYKLAFNIPLLSDILFLPMKRKADYIYSSADEIVAVSETYANRALQANKKKSRAHSIFLGTDLKGFDNFARSECVACKPKKELWIAYLGTLGHSYDIDCVTDAMKILQDNGVENLKLVVMGDGPLRENFENHAERHGVNAYFTGRMDYPQMVAMLSMCDVAVNPIAKGAAQSIINKHGDYAAAGLPIVNTQECPEYRNLIESYQCGFNCENNNSIDIADKIMTLVNDAALRVNMGRNSRRLAEERFDRAVTYERIFALIRKSHDETCKIPYPYVNID